MKLVLNLRAKGTVAAELFATAAPTLTVCSAPATNDGNGDEGSDHAPVTISFVTALA